MTFNKAKFTQGIYKQKNKNKNKNKKKNSKKINNR